MCIIYIYIYIYIYIRERERERERDYLGLPARCTAGCSAKLCHLLAPKNEEPPIFVFRSWKIEEHPIFGGIC